MMKGKRILIICIYSACLFFLRVLYRLWLISRVLFLSDFTVDDTDNIITGSSWLLTQFSEEGMMLTHISFPIEGYTQICLKHSWPRSIDTFSQQINQMVLLQQLIAKCSSEIQTTRITINTLVSTRQ